MDRKLKIAVIFGGCSSEYPVSLESAHSVIVNLDRDKYELVLLGITKGGEWFRYYGGPEALEDDSWSADRSKCVVYKINCKQFCAKMKVYGFKNAKSKIIPCF